MRVPHGLAWECDKAKRERTPPKSPGTRSLATRSRARPFRSRSFRSALPLRDAPSCDRRTRQRPASRPGGLHGHWAAPPRPASQT
eukprot:187120-Prymnesium_polylepis.1